jgi:multiple sugar transport system substrate-binding protein
MRDRTIDNRLGIQVLDELKIHLEYLHHESINWNPIQILNRMAEENEILYSPFLFGYTNYSRSGYAKKLLKFGNSPTNSNIDVSTILGGVGLAISSHCEHQDVASDYINYVAMAETQVGIYTKNGGQPGNFIAWQSEVNNALCNDFFINTLETMKKAYVRPQHMGWNKFQEQGAELLHNGLVKDIPSDTIMKKLNQLYQSI